MQNILKCEQIFIAWLVLVPSEAIKLVQVIIFLQRMFGCWIFHKDADVLKTNLKGETFSSLRFFEIAGTNLLNMHLSQQYPW